VEPQFHYLSFPVWYLPGWDRLRNAIRYFRADCTRSMRVLTETFCLADPRPYLEVAEQGIAEL
jgi:predicted DNA-binding transcriptional regulator YafY